MKGIQMSKQKNRILNKRIIESPGLCLSRLYSESVAIFDTKTKKLLLIVCNRSFTKVSLGLIGSREDCTLIRTELLPCEGFSLPESITQELTSDI
jgi:hypothetical protein